MPQPRLDWTKAAFELSYKLTSAMVLYVGVPMISGIDGNGMLNNLVTILE